MRIFFVIIMIFFFSCEKQEDVILLVPCEGDDCIIYETSPYPTPTPNGFPLMIIPDDNPLTFEGVALGKKLFFDPILSSDNSISCASCHIQNNSFSDPSQFSIGITGESGFRNASSLVNLGWSSSFNWDGSAINLREQVFEPVVNPIEMANNWDQVEYDLNFNSEYRDLFKQAFNID